ncbi:MAG: long-chain fatty acid--CoA ligase [Pseudomonadota bacterium]
MQGLMMNRPLLTTELLRHAVRNFRTTEIVTRTVEGPIHRYTVTDADRRIAQLAHALQRMGVRPGDRIGVIGWNTYRQFEMYYAVGGIGAVLHTINPRLGPENASYVINHAADDFIFCDITFLPLVEALMPHLSSVKKVVVLTDDAHLPDSKLDLVAYESLIAPEEQSFDFPEFDENSAVAMCYTSGTTGNPKGVLYSHRAIVLQTLATGSTAGLGPQESDVILPIVPMFHVNAWNIPYSAMIAGSKQVYPGPRLDGEGLYVLLEGEKVNYALGVPTVWLGLLGYLKETGKTLTHLKMAFSGGSALSEVIIDGFAEHGVEVQQGWGMTEMSPVGTVNKLPPHAVKLPRDQRIKMQLKAGRSMPFVEMRLTDDDGAVQPHDGITDGRLQVRGPWIIDEYYKADAPTGTPDGWFDTGDVATIDPDGFLQITDRSKDVIKSGGEWISSIEIENAALSHPDVAQAAVIAIHHPKWQERPLLIIERVNGTDPSKKELSEFVNARLPKIAWPDAIEFVDAIPLGATGKVLKTELRKMFKDYKFPGT